MTRVSAVLFDKDGTLFDFSATWANWAAGVVLELAKGDMALASRMGTVVGFDLETRQFVPNGVAAAGTSDEIAQGFAAVLSQPFEGVRDVINRKAAAVQGVPAAPLGPLMRELRDMGLKLGVATNDAEATARAQLEGAGLAQVFDFISGFDSGGVAKPAPDMCLAFAKAVSCAPQNVVMVGDSLHDLQAGRAAGMMVVGVLTGAACAADLRPFADAILPSIAALPGWLETRCDAT